jgi:DNA-binding PadR family transcriptional regulator
MTSSKTALGGFEHHVLLVALRLGADAYTTSILHELEARTQREVSPAAVYVALRRMEQAGLVKSLLRETTEMNERRQRRYIRVTATGLAMVREARTSLLSLWDGLHIVTGARA